MKATVELITPEEALEILEKHNPRNRSISESTVQAYAMDMRNKRWTLTHQGIAFDTNGNLLDGQHRLWAVVFSGVATEFWVFRDVPVKCGENGVEIFTMDAIDKGRIRTTGQQMQLCHNIKNGNVVAAAIRGIAAMSFPNVGTKRLSTANSLFIYDLYGKDVERIAEVMTGPNLRVAALTAPLSVYHHGEKDKALDIARQLQTLENLSNPVRGLIKYMAIHKGEKSDSRMRVVCCAILAFHEGRSTTRMQDLPGGMQFINGMFPSITKKIKDAVTPIRTNISNQKGKVK